MPKIVAKSLNLIGSRNRKSIETSGKNLSMNLHETVIIPVLRTGVAPLGQSYANTRSTAKIGTDMLLRSLLYMSVKEILISSL